MAAATASLSVSEQSPIAALLQAPALPTRERSTKWSATDLEILDEPRYATLLDFTTGIADLQRSQSLTSSSPILVPVLPDASESMFFWFRPKMTKDEATKQLGIKKINGDFFVVTGSIGLTLVRWDAATMKTKLASVMQVVPLRF